MLVESATLLAWYQLWGIFGNGRVSVRPLCSISRKPSSMSMLGQPYSPIVPSLTRWQSGLFSTIAKITLRLFSMLFIWVRTAWRRSFIEYGADGIWP